MFTFLTQLILYSCDVITQNAGQLNEKKAIRSRGEGRRHFDILDHLLYLARARVLVYGHVQSAGSVISQMTIK